MVKWARGMKLYECNNQGKTIILKSNHEFWIIIGTKENLDNNQNVAHDDLRPADPFSETEEGNVTSDIGNNCQGVLCY